jgi:predicted small metal-binding protein
MAAIRERSRTLEEGQMTKVVNCKDVGFDCEGVIRAETEEEVLRLVAEHAKEVHGIEEVPPEVVEKVRAVMYEE